MEGGTEAWKDGLRDRRRDQEMKGGTEGWKEGLRDGRRS